MEQTVKEAKKPVRKKTEPRYTIPQLKTGYKTFGTSVAVVECALKLSGRDDFTISEAEKVINEFKNKR